MAEFFGSYAIWIVWIIFGAFFLFFLVTAPCHAVLLLPLLGLPLFWLLPLGYALPINIATWLATPFLYRVIRRAMIRPAKDGFQSLIGTTAEVVSKSETGLSAKYLVRVQGEGELWSAYSTDALDIGEWVNIVSVRGISLVVERAENGSHIGETGNAKIMPPGAKDNRRHCH
jgi:membrane protein implicated in regulation of membrane protease activity